MTQQFGRLVVSLAACNVAKGLMASRNHVTLWFLDGTGNGS